MNALRSLGNFATKKIIKQFAERYHFVYFGHVDPREDDYEMVRGITASTTHTDNHYTVGSYNSHDIILVERRNTLHYPGKPDSVYTWLIMQFDLANISLPHAFLDTRHHDATFYANAFVGNHTVQDITSAITAGTFAHYCKLFANPAAYQTLASFLTPEITETIARHFNQFDYEILDDKLFVYACNSMITPVLLTDMLRIGTWLADQLNNAGQPAL